jgi:2-iminobutanoate/2-iminopropanoate deaminase
MGSTKRVVTTNQAPKALGPYSLAIRTDNLVFMSGTIGVDPASGDLVSGGVGSETRQALTNMQNILAGAGSDLSAVVKTTVFLTDIKDYSEVNAIYAEFFAEDPPARSAVQVVALPGGAQVEIEAIALV